MNNYVNSTIELLNKKYPNEPEFVQAVSEVLESVDELFDDNSIYTKANLLQRLIVPDRIITFKVVWEDDNHQLQVNTGYRVQFNNAVGPYKGGLRFNPSVNLSILKFLGFEQIFKNALTTLPIGGAKGGSDFDPKGKSDGEIFRFCQAFMQELYKYIGPNEDVPAGDMGVGAREIGYLYGVYKKLTSISHLGVLTGKPLGMGGSLVRKEATGFGLIYFVEKVCQAHNIDYHGINTIISGSGNVAIYAAQKAMEKGFNVIGMSDSKGYILDENLNLDIIKTIKEVNRSTLKEYVDLAHSGRYFEGSIYDDDSIHAQIVLPCAKENEINEARALRLVKNGTLLVGEGANMPSDNQAINVYKRNGIIYCPGKAANAGGVATSCLEMGQNARFYFDSFDIVDKQLESIMGRIFEQCVDAMKYYHIDRKDYQKGANLAAMKKVCDSMLAQGEF